MNTRLKMLLHSAVGKFCSGGLYLSQSPTFFAFLLVGISRHLSANDSADLRWMIIPIMRGLMTIIGSFMNNTNCPHYIESQQYNFGNVNNPQLSGKRRHPLAAYGQAVNNWFPSSDNHILLIHP